MPPSGGTTEEENMDMNEYLTIKRYLENSLKELKKDLQKEKAHIGNENLVNDQANIKRLQRIQTRKLWD